MNRNKIIAPLIVAVACAANARASVVDYTGLGFHSTVKFTHNGSTMQTPAGEILIDFNNEMLTAYCVDIDHGIKPTWDATIAPVTDINNGLAIAFLYDTFHGGIVNNIQAAALQIAIWEVLDDFGGGVNLSAGDFKLLTTGDIKTTAESYLSALPADLSGYNTPSYILLSGDYPRSQNLIVPEPGTLVVLMLLAPLLAIRRRAQTWIPRRAA